LKLGRNWKLGNWGQPPFFGLPTPLRVCSRPNFLTIVWIIFYIFALEIEETSAVVPWFLSVPIFGYILGYLFLGETLNPAQIKGSLIILLGLIFISLDFGEERGKIKHKPALYMIFACIAIAVSGIIFKYVTVENNFWISSFWEYFSLGIAGLFIFLFVPHYRKSFLHMNKTGGRMIFIVNILSELASVAGNLLTNFALLLAPVAAVFLVGSFQPAIVLFLTIFGTIFFPHIIKENLSWERLMPKFIAIILIIIGSTFFF